jgi:uncharacterized membrane protein YqaE (UPF0057 family)
MVYLLAILLPPVAVLLTGTRLQALLNLLLTLIGYVPGMIHAILVIMWHKADQHDRAMYRAINEQE